MKITMDARAALWYRGSGMGTYSYQLMRSLYLLNQNNENEYDFILPQGLCEYAQNPVDSPVFQSLSYAKEFFWEALLEERVCPQNCDVFHIPHNGIGFPLKVSYPVIVTVHDLIPYIMPETVGQGYLQIFLEEMPVILEKAAHIIAVSENTKKDLIDIMGVASAKITTVYEAAENIYKPLQKQAVKNFLTEKYGITGPYILYLGGFGPRKNVSGLLNAFAELCRDIGDYKLLLAGKHTPAFKLLVKQAAKLDLGDKIRFLGFVPMCDMPYLYNGAELFVYPSLYEGFGLPPLEAMRCGTPTIVADSSSLPEIVGEGALKVKAGDSCALAQAMFGLLTNKIERQELALSGRCVAGRYSWAKAAVQTLRVYEKSGLST
ncbi:MAG: glycosyltransferase family 1 protein [Clostridia bacterium]|nr:glycosyltransferase family 1 protein [Clostridia bacterium]